ncbi:hypothetical protein GBF38_016377 [Nibea albiflora]|uniref:Uncharacterized protein n=1 Tax=Nibea albiflora TaxID=240163 RepID=A0ACB7FIH2_NIBAL|nr:hypothetical protein GBF38_016377 [Nibea albiflora]
MRSQSPEESEPFPENRMTLRDQVKYLSAQFEKEKEFRRRDHLQHEEEVERLRREFRQKYDRAINVKQEMIVTLERQLELNQKDYAIKLNQLKLQKADNKESSSAKEGTVTEFSKTEQESVEMLLQLQNLSREYNNLCSEYDKLSVENGDLREKYNNAVSTKEQSVFLLKEKCNTMQEEKNNNILEHEKQVENMTSVFQKIAHDVDLMKQQASERHMELERLKIHLHEQNSQNSLLVAGLQAEKDLNKVLNSELQRFKNQVHQTEEPLCLSQDLERPQELSSCDLQDLTYEECVPQNPEPVGEGSPSVTQGVGLTAGATGGEENAAVTTKQHSIWKKTRHFLGLRKKTKVKNAHHQTESLLVVAESGCVSHDSVIAESGCVSPNSVVAESGCVSQDAGPLVPGSPSGPENTNLNSGATGGDENSVVTEKKKSVWKRTRHFLGLRKNKTREEESQSSSDTLTRTNVR